MSRNEQPLACLPSDVHEIRSGPPTSPFAEMAMYPSESLRPAWDALYRAVAGRLPDAPPDLCWDLDAHDTHRAWLSPQLALGMTCGWPLVTELLDRVRVIGTFEYEIDGVVSHTYRSTIIARDSSTFSELVNGTLAYNAIDSLSGFVSAISLLPPMQATWPGSTMETGAHLASIDAVREGRADVASIDALTWTYTKRDAPDVLQGLVIIDRGPEVPHLPLIANVSTTDEALADWRSVFADVVRNPALAPTLDRLLIHGFVALDYRDYSVSLAPLHRIGM